MFADGGKPRLDNFICVMKIKYVDVAYLGGEQDIRLLNAHSDFAHLIFTNVDGIPQSVPGPRHFPTQYRLSYPLPFNRPRSQSFYEQAHGEQEDEDHGNTGDGEARHERAPVFNVFPIHPHQPHCQGEHAVIAHHD